MRATSPSLLTVAALFMTVAIVCPFIDLASQDYRGVLLIGLGATTVAVGCCAGAFARGSAVARWSAVMIALPSLFIVWDFLRRAPAAFR